MNIEMQILQWKYTEYKQSVNYYWMTSKRQNSEMKHNESRISGVILNIIEVSSRNESGQ